MNANPPADSSATPGQLTKPLHETTCAWCLLEAVRHHSPEPHEHGVCDRHRERMLIECAVMLAQSKGDQESGTGDHFKELANRLRDPECYVDACDEAADWFEHAAEAVDKTRPGLLVVLP